MIAPWVTFDSITTYKGNCNNGADPDIAGIGVRDKNKSPVFAHVFTFPQVVISFILASVMTTVASIFAMSLDRAFDSKGQFSVQMPITYVREQFLDTGWKKEYA